jgi:hypothetical protein
MYADEEVTNEEYELLAYELNMAISKKYETVFKKVD